MCDCLQKAASASDWLIQMNSIVRKNGIPKGEDMDKIAILIPCYNEEKTIAKVVSDAKAALPEAVIYVYDNNSSDKTVELAGQAGGCQQA